MWNYGASTKHRTAKTTERKSPQNATEGIVSEEESSAGVLATALKEFQEIIVKLSLLPDLSNVGPSQFHSGIIDTLSVSSMQGWITTAKQRISDVEDTVSGNERSLSLLKKRQRGSQK